MAVTLPRRLLLAGATRSLSARDRLVLDLRFFQGCTQAEIGAEIGVMQMQVSRILSRIIASLRAQIGEPDGLEDCAASPGLRIRK